MFNRYISIKRGGAFQSLLQWVRNWNLKGCTYMAKAHLTTICGEPTMCQAPKNESELDMLSTPVAAA